jgi:hypothetical protein
MRGYITISRISHPITYILLLISRIPSSESRNYIYNTRKNSYTNKKLLIIYIYLIIYKPKAYNINNYIIIILKSY